MPAVSKRQRRFMGMVKAIQEGKPVPGASSKIKEVAKKMDPASVNKFAKTKEKKLPTRSPKKGSKMLRRSKGDTFKMYQ